MKKLSTYLSFTIAFTALFVIKSSAQFTSLPFNSSTTWTVPAGVTSINVYLWGGGGAGGSGYTGCAQDGNGSGGGGGACASATNVAVTVGNVYTITIGGGGVVGGTNGAAPPATAGGTTTFAGAAGTWTAAGGAAGTAGTACLTNLAGGLGGSTGTGPGVTFRTGGNGSQGKSNSGGGNITGNGGGAGGSTGNGTTPANTCAGGNAAGGSGTYPGGNGSLATVNCGATGGGNPGTAGFAPGGGGGGGRGYTTSVTGGAGAAGRVVVEYTIALPPPTVSSFAPSSSCVGQSVVITGTNYSGVTAVRIGGVNVASFVVNSVTQITAVLAAGNTGTVQVVTGAGTGTSIGTFTTNTAVAPVISACPSNQTITGSCAGATASWTAPTVSDPACGNVTGPGNSLTLNANGTWTVPSGVTSVTAYLWGGGGGGGGGYTGCSQDGCGSGGGGGACASATFAVTAGNVYTATIGAAGAAGAANSNGGNGGTTTFTGPAGTWTAGGGTGGIGNTSCVDIAGGAGSAVGTGTGVTVHAGGSGSMGLNSTSQNISGNGGGGGGSGANGTTPANNCGSGNAAGGTGTFPGGNGSPATSGCGVNVTNQPGLAGVAPGGGGGGGIGYTVAETGGAGGAGRVTLTWAGTTYPIIVQTAGLASGATFPVGTSTVTYTATGASGLTSSCSFTITVNAPTATPTSTAATSIGCNNFNANWNSVSGATGYFIDVTTDPTFTTITGTGALNNQSVGNVTTYTVGGLAQSVTYYYRVRATGNCTLSANSGSQTVTTTNFTSAPTATAATNVQCTTMSANWSLVPGATYFLDVTTDPTFATLTLLNNLNVGSVVTYPVTGLTQNTTYYYQVRASSSCGLSANSNPITATSGIPAAITTQPSNYTGCPSGNASFTVVASGAVSYQWRKNGVNIANGATGNGSTYAGVTTATLNVNGAVAADQCTTINGFDCVITGGCTPNVTTNRVSLSVADATPPTITGIPANQTINASGGQCTATATFTAPGVTDNCPGAVLVSGSQTFNYSGSIVNFTVPTGVTSLTIHAMGAQGSGNGGGTGGLGADVQGVFTVTGGQVLSILVGQTPSGLTFAGGGGGSFVANGASYTTATPMIVAGGGGGSTSGTGQGGQITNITTTGDGGGPVPGTAGNGAAGTTCGGGGGGFFTSGGNDVTFGTAGAGGAGFRQGGAGGVSTSGYESGGFGGGSTPDYVGSCNMQAGAGGGYSGGSGQNNGNVVTVGYGGGSYNIGTAQVNTAAAHAGMGQVVISWNTTVNYPIVVQTAGLSSGSAFPTGVTTNTFLATDGSGNTATASFTVTVVNNQPPVFGGCPTNQNLVADNTCHAVATWVTPVAIDPCTNTFANTQTIAYSGTANVAWPVPAGVNSINVDMAGAAGANGTYGSGGLGGRTQATLAVTGGTTIFLNVGGTGSGVTGGFNGGGTAGNVTYGGGGGGASDIRVGGTALTNRVLVAGGGGGAGDDCATAGYQNGGAGGGTTGAAGFDCNVQATVYCGLGGTQSAGGAYGSDLGQGCGGAGVLGIGGNGSCTYGGGGGGGYYGGGGGGYSGGGGGSGYVGTGTSATTLTPGFRAGNGYITITYFSTPVALTLGQNSGTSFPLGTTTEQYTATDASGNTATCGFTITVSGCGPPTVTSLNNANSCPLSTVIITGTNFNGSTNVSFNGTAAQSFVINSPTQITAVVGAGTSGTGTVTVTNGFGTGTYGGSFTVFAAPVITTCPGNQNVSTGSGLCGAILNFAAVATNYTSLTYTTNSGSTFPVGTTIDTVTASNTGCSTTCTFTVVVSDNTPPAVTNLPSNITVNATSGICSAVVNFTAPGVSDNCSGPVQVSGSQTFNYTGSIVNFTVPTGVTTLTVRAKGAQGGSNAGTGGFGADVQGNFTVSAGQILSILVGQQPSGLTFSGGGGGSFVALGASYTTATPMLVAGGGGGGVNAQTGQGGQITNITTTGDGGGPVPGTSGNGAPSSTCAGGGGGFYTSGGNDLSFGTAGAGGAGFRQGGAGGVSTSGYESGGFGGGSTPDYVGSCNMQAGSGGGYSGGSALNSGALQYVGYGGGSYNSGAAQVNTAASNAGNGVVTLSWNQTVNYPIIVQTAGLTSGATYPVGVTTNTYQATDAVGNTTTAAFTVTVVDNQPPVFTSCPGNQTLAPGSGCTAVATWANPVATDNCSSGNVTQTFNFTGTSNVAWVVPANVTSITVDVQGAQGGSGGNATLWNPGGLGGRQQGTFAVSAGQTLFINVGGVGGNETNTAAGAGGFNGGGNGGNQVTWLGGGGGGASDIRLGGTLLTNRIFVAGGGGGGGDNTNVANQEYGGVGGATTTAAGAGWYNGIQNGSTAYCGQGGTQVAGGAAGTDCQGSASGLGVGGNVCAGNSGGGGGGGYYGGGCGSHAGGGGGSNFASVSATATATAAGFKTGAGLVTISYAQAPTVVQIAGLSSGSSFPIGVTTNTFRASDLSGNTTACTFTITVTAPTLTSSSTGTACSGAPFNYTPASTTGGTVFTWTRAVVTGITNAAGSGSGNISETLVNSTTAAVVVTYTYHVSNGLCTNPNSFPLTVTVAPGAATATLTGCSYIDPSGNLNTSFDVINITANGTLPQTFTANNSGTDHFMSNSGTNSAEFSAPLNGASHGFTVVDNAGCHMTASVTTQSTSPTDIPYTSTSNHESATCFQNNVNQWITFYDNSNNAILQVFDPVGVNIGNVTATVWKDATDPDIINNCGFHATALRRHYILQSDATQPFSSPVQVRLFLTDAELTQLETASQANNNNDFCTHVDDVFSINDLFVTKYDDPNPGRPTENGSYTDNLSAGAGGIYKVYGNPAIIGSFVPNGPLSKDSAGFPSLFNGGQARHYIQLSVSEFSELWINGAFDFSTPLPVTMLYLEAYAIDNSFIQVKWGTAIEINNNHFEVERSLDAQNWTSIGQVAGHNNTTTESDYSYNDMNVLAGTHYYYRLKQVDNNGQFVYTEVVTAMLTGQTTFRLIGFSPNPTSSLTNLMITTTKNQEVTVDLFDMLGRKVVSGKHQITTGANQIEFDLAGLASGTYSAIVTSANEIYTQKLVITK